MSEIIAFKARQALAAEPIQADIDARVRRWKRRRRLAGLWERYAPLVGLALALASCLAVLWAAWGLVLVVWP